MEKVSYIVYTSANVSQARKTVSFYDEDGTRLLKRTMRRWHHIVVPDCCRMIIHANKDLGDVFDFSNESLLLCKIAQVISHFQYASVAQMDRASPS